jgi:hypothetical protein
VGVGFTLRPRTAFREITEAAGLEVSIAITRLAKDGPVFRFCFALSIYILLFLRLFRQIQHALTAS